MNKNDNNIKRSLNNRSENSRYISNNKKSGGNFEIFNDEEYDENDNPNY